MLDPDNRDMFPAFITHRALITIRKDNGLDIGAVVDHWDASRDLAAYGVGYLLYCLIDYLVDGYFVAVQSLDDSVEVLEDKLFDDVPQDRSSGDFARRSPGLEGP
jgi:magnesium transporter